MIKSYLYNSGLLMSFDPSSSFLPHNQPTKSPIEIVANSLHEQLNRSIPVAQLVIALEKAIQTGEAVTIRQTFTKMPPSSDLSGRNQPSAPPMRELMTPQKPPVQQIQTSSMDRSPPSIANNNQASPLASSNPALSSGTNKAPIPQPIQSTSPQSPSPQTLPNQAQPQQQPAQFQDFQQPQQAAQKQQEQTNLQQSGQPQLQTTTREQVTVQVYVSDGRVVLEEKIEKKESQENGSKELNTAVQNEQASEKTGRENYKQQVGNPKQEASKEKSDLKKEDPALKKELGKQSEAQMKESAGEEKHIQQSSKQNSNPEMQKMGNKEHQMQEAVKESGKGAMQEEGSKLAQMPQGQGAQGKMQGMQEQTKLSTPSALQSQAEAKASEQSQKGLPPQLGTAAQNLSPQGELKERGQLTTTLQQQQTQQAAASSQTISNGAQAKGQMAQIQLQPAQAFTQTNAALHNGGAAVNQAQQSVQQNMNPSINLFAKEQIRSERNTRPSGKKGKYSSEKYQIEEAQPAFDSEPEEERDQREQYEEPLENDA